MVRFFITTLGMSHGTSSSRISTGERRHAEDQRADMLRDRPAGLDRIRAGLMGAVDEPATKKPNIIFIMADDLGWGDLGSYGQKIIPTPHLDRLAEEGTRFTQVYAGSTVCAPSRCVLMTGFHTGHARIRGNARDPILPEDVTVAEASRPPVTTPRWSVNGGLARRVRAEFRTSRGSITFSAI